MQRDRLPYVESHTGWRSFFVAILLAAVLGLGFRLYFSSVRLKTWVTTGIESQKKKSAHPFAVSFDRASLSLARGWIPEFAVVLTGVKIAPSTDCHPEASITIGRLRLPFRLRSLAIGRVALGLINAEDMRVDLDGLRARCARTQPPEWAAEPVVTAPVAAAPTESSALIVATAPQPWWTDEQFEKARAIVEGIEFSRATLEFEDHRKEIYLDSFEAIFRSGGRIGVQTEMRIPPPVVYHEDIPPLKVEGEATSEKANLVISVRVSEGSLVTKANFTPGENQTLRIDANLTVRSLPLSMITPLMRKSGLADQKFNPKFLWLDCDASISGAFQGLFQKHPLTLRDCHIEGDGTDIQLKSAERLPTGVWSPFTVQIVSLDLAKLLATVGVRGPDGVIAQFGRLQGDLHFEATDSARFEGSLRDVDLSFSNQSVRALQKIESIGLAVTIAKDQVNARFEKPILRNGEVDGFLSLHLDRSLKRGSAEATIGHLSFDPAVQSLLVNGTFGTVDGVAKATIQDSRITDFSARIKLGSTTGSVLKFEGLEVVADRKGDEPPKVIFDSPALQLNQGSAFFKSLEPAFFGHVFDGEWIPLRKFHAETALFGPTETTVFEWSRATAVLEAGQIQFTSIGALTQDRQLSGVFQLDYPLVKKLAWKLTGSLAAPALSDQAESLAKFKSRVEINDRVLGLKNSK